MLKLNIADIEFKNPIIAASGTFGFGREFEDFYDLSILGGISTKGLTLNAREGNTGIRIYETSSGIINSIGLENPGVEAFIEKELQNMQNYNTNIIANIGGSTIDDYKKCVELINKTDIDIIELNISCPNVKEGGMAFGIECDSARKIVKEIRKATQKVLIVKLSPNARNIVDIALTVEDEGADAISLVNTFSAIAIDIDSRKAVFDNIIAGLSGPAIKPIALRMVRDVYKAVSIPIIGMGGICNYKDVIEYIMVGAKAVQIGTANFNNPTTMLEIVSDLEKFLLKENIKNLDEIRGII